MCRIKSNSEVKVLDKHRSSWSMIVVFCVLSVVSQAQQSFDTVLINGHIIDGTGSPWYSGDIGIREGKIAAIGNLSQAKRGKTIDARGDVVAPGFIDMLGQSELTILVDPRLPSKIYQGITTEITGEGGSAAPLNDAIIQADQDEYTHLHISADWRTLGQYFTRLENRASESTLPRTSEPHRFAVWCLEMRMFNR